MEQNLTYEEAYRELALIAKEIENENVSVDVLAQKEVFITTGRKFHFSNYLFSF